MALLLHTAVVVTIKFPVHTHRAIKWVDTLLKADMLNRLLVDIHKAIKWVGILNKVDIQDQDMEDREDTTRILITHNDVDRRRSSCGVWPFWHFVVVVVPVRRRRNVFAWGILREAG